MIHRTRFAVAIIGTALFLQTAFPWTSWAEDPTFAKVQGVDIYAYPPQTEEIDGIPTTPADVAMSRLSEALNRLVEASPWANQEIARLLKKGKVELFYDARHPANTMTEVNIATYLPDYYDPDEGRHRFVILVGRTGIQWTITELAGALAHEMAGHAVQRLEGRISYMRLLDVECEAYLIHERANQDLGLDKTTREAITIRNSMDNYWCDDFRRHTLQNNLPAATEWDELNPDVPVLLDAFRNYLKR